MPMGGALNKALILVIVLLAVVGTAAAACGSDADPTPSRRPAGTTAPSVTTPPLATNTPAPTITPTTAAPADTPDAPNGQAVFIAKGCGACHTIQGLDGAGGAIGPELTQVATIAASRIAGTSAEAYIRQSIEDPPSFLVEDFGPVMPANIRDTMTDQEFEGLVAYLLQQK